VPNYNFVTHSREQQTTPLYGADVIIVVSWLSFVFAARNRNHFVLLTEKKTL
jgi:uridine kinase